MDNLSVNCYNDNLMMDNGVTGDDINLNLNSGTTRTAKKGTHGNGRSKLARLDQAELKHSTDSLLSTMERFVQTVDEMNETILVPSRLMDTKFDAGSMTEALPVPTLTNSASSHSLGLGLGGGGGQTYNGLDEAAGGEIRLMKNLDGIDLHQFYTMLNTVKNNLLWGNKSKNNNNNSGGISNCSHSVSQLSIAAPASVSVASAQIIPSPTPSVSVEIKGHVRRPSTVSTTSSTSASDTEFSELNDDSGVEAEDEYAAQMADSFHHHLDGLQHCLRDMTLAADYVTNRYNTDLGAVDI